MERTFRLVYDTNREHLQAALDHQRSSYDKRRNEHYFQPGDGVWLYNPRRRVGRTPKLDSPWEPDPYAVVKTIGDVLCVIQRKPRCKSKVIHKDKLLPVRGEFDGSWVLQLTKAGKYRRYCQEDYTGIAALFEPKPVVSDNHNQSTNDGSAVSVAHPVEEQEVESVVEPVAQPMVEPEVQPEEGPVEQLMMEPVAEPMVEHEEREVTYQGPMTRSRTRQENEVQ
jgi:hypothetical protein